MGITDKLESFAGARCADSEVIRDGLTYGDVREALRAMGEKIPDDCRAPETWAAARCVDCPHWGSEDCEGEGRIP